jgi:hypothetical protein
MTLIGHLIVAEVVSGVARPTVIYTPWSGRQGNAFTSILDKNSDQTGDAPNGAVGSFDTITAAGTSNKRVSGLRELVRYKIVLKRKAGTGTGTVYAHLRLLAPSWETSGAQGN